MTILSRQAALEYLKAGLSVIPMKLDGSKSPPMKEWAPYQTRLPSEAEVNRWFARDYGIAIICGAISGNLETIDFETEDHFDQWRAIVDAQDDTITPRLVITLTPGSKFHDQDGSRLPGRHVRYRVLNYSVPGSVKLATDEANKVMVETRGEGGYALAPGGNPRAHASGQPYRDIQGSICELPVLSLEQRNLLIDAARSLNRYVEPEKHYCPKESSQENTGERPGDFFNARADWSFLLQFGWAKVSQSGNTVRWKRPGKDTPGISATTGYCKGQDGTERLFVFSTNAAPFQSGQVYSPFAAYALLVHGGDFRAAALDLKQQSQSETGVYRIYRISGTSPEETNDGAETQSDQAESEAEPAQADPTEEGSDGDWPQIIPLSSLPQVLRFPVEVFPALMTDYVCEVAESLGSPVDFVALAAMTIAASEIGNTRSLFIKNGYYESCRLFSLLVGDVGTAKTHALALPAEPLRNRHRKWKEDYDLQMVSYRKELEQYELDRKKAKKVKRVCETSPPEKPRFRQNHVDNFTLEALAGIMNDNPRGVTVIKDEATGWLSQMNAYRGGRGDDRQFFLSCFTGQCAKVDRKNHPDGLPIVLSHPFLNILSTIQPDLLFKLCTGNVSLDGLLERFLYSFPDAAPIPFYSDHGIGDPTRKHWQELCDQLSLLESAYVSGSGYVPVVCSFTVEAKACWTDNLNNKLIQEARIADLPKGLRAYVPKLKMYFGRFALLLELLKNAILKEPDRAPKVSLQTVFDAWKLVEYFHSTYRRVHAQLRLDPVTAQAARILTWIRRERPVKFKRYRLFEDVKNNEMFRDINSLNAPLAKLCDHHYLRRSDPPSTGIGRPPSAEYEVHPSLLNDVL